MDLISSDLSRAEAGAALTARDAVVSAVTAFSADLFGALASSSTTNLVCSPYSVAVALGMTVQGAAGATATQILAVLHSRDAAVLAEGLNEIDLALVPRSKAASGSAGDNAQPVELSSANSLWGQLDVTWQQPFLDVLARDFGTGMRVVDYGRAEAARAEVNAWVSEQTRARVPELIPAGVFDASTRLTLANALYLKAPWRTPFQSGMTRESPFHRLDGSTVTTSLMHAPTGNRFATGPGWTAVDLPYAGGRLAMAVVVPDTGRFAEVEKALTGEWLSRLLAGFRPAPVRVGLPRWTIRTQAGLSEILAGLGMPAAFTDAADFSAMTSQQPLKISAVVHEGFIAVDEAGTEAAAATAAVMMLTSAVLAPPRSVIADRPFVYIIHDRPTSTPLFIGRVLDPTST